MVYDRPQDTDNSSSGAVLPCGLAVTYNFTLVYYSFAGTPTWPNGQLTFYFAHNHIIFHKSCARLAQRRRTLLSAQP